MMTIKTFSVTGPFTALMLSLVATIATAAEIEVVESTPTSVVSQPRIYSNSDVTDYRPSDTQTEMLLQIQSLQTELMQLRGMLEEQNYRLEQLQQRRVDDYVDLDRRITALSNPNQASNSAKTTQAPKSSKPKVVVPQKPSVASSSVSVKAPAPVVKPPVAEKPKAVQKTAESTVYQVGQKSPDDEKGSEAFKAAYAKVKERQFDQAKIAMVAFINDYPKHRYVPNAHFWLGELYYYDSEMDKSKASYTILLEDYSAFRKVPDAKFKLAKIYHQRGENKKAKVLLQSVVSEHKNSRVAGMAEDYLANSM